MSNVLYRCMCCGNEEVHPNGVDGVRGLCGGHLKAISLTNKPITKQPGKDEITIKLTNANEPPVVILNGEQVRVNSLDLEYRTDTDEPGTHNFSILYIDEKDRCYRLAGFKK